MYMNIKTELQSCYVQTCYVTNLLRFKLATRQTFYGVKLATYKVATLPNRYNLLWPNLLLNINVTKLLRPNLQPSITLQSCYGQKVALLRNSMK